MLCGHGVYVLMDMTLLSMTSIIHFVWLIDICFIFNILVVLFVYMHVLRGSFT